jgi:hypothetical protein
MQNRLQVEAYLIVDGGIRGQLIRVDIPDLPDPRIEQLRLEVITAQNEAQEAWLRYYELRKAQRPWWSKLLGRGL